MRGAVDYISKPFDPAEVVARVRNQLGMRRLGRQLCDANLTLRANQIRLEEDLRTAAAIQRALLPARPPSIRGVGVAWRFLRCE